MPETTRGSTPCTDRELMALLRSHGLRATRTRCLLLSLTKETNAHPTAEDAVRELRARGHPMAVATAYQNLSAFAERGLLVRFFGRNGLSRFDGNLAPHHHLICTRCGRIADVEPAGAGDAGGLETDGPASSWRIEQRRLELLGVCPECQRCE